MKRDTIILIASGLTLLFLLYYNLGEIIVIHSIYSMLGVKGMTDSDYSKLHQVLDRRIIGLLCSSFLALLQGAIIFFAWKPKNETRSA
jgi:hypothetical protein